MNGDEDAEVVIVPPADIKQVVDKTAEYVAQVGPSFEAKVYAKEKNNPKFQFLMPQSHYHAYYRQQIERAKQAAAAPPPDREAAPREPDEQQQAAAAQEQEAQDAHRKEEQRAPLEPPPELVFAAELPESISAVALDVVGLAAQHVALNGPPFLQALLNRERNTPLFAFLDSSHAHHELFESLVRQYEHVLQRHKAGQETREQLLAEDRAAVLQRVLKRVEWERAEREKKAREVAAAKKGIARADDDVMASQVDWDDFVVVQLIELADDTSVLPPPLTVAQLRALAALKETQSQLPGAALPPAVPAPSAPVAFAAIGAAQPPPSVKAEEAAEEAPTDGGRGGVRVVQGYTPGGAAPSAGAALTQKCPICGQQIAIAEMEQHMKIETMSKRHIEHLKEVSQGKKSAMAPDDEIAANIQAFSRVRTDIFDTGSETPEAMMQKKRKLEASKGAAAWDGHADSVDAAVSLEAQIRAIHATKGSDKQQPVPAIGPSTPVRAAVSGAGGSGGSASFAAPLASGAVPPTAAMHPYLHPGNQPSAPVPVAVAAVGTLMDEEQWAAVNPSPFEIAVTVAREEASDKNKGWKLDGATHTFAVQNTTAVEELKQMLEIRVGLPPNLQKLKHVTKGFLKDKDSLAFYNLRQGDVLELTRQQRGGKKK